MSRNIEGHPGGGGGGEGRKEPLRGVASRLHLMLQWGGGGGALISKFHYVQWEKERLNPNVPNVSWLENHLPNVYCAISVLDC